MKTGFWAAVVVFCGLAGPAGAQTLLQLSATGSDTVQPDQIAASLTVQASEATASAAQADVNRLMGTALSAARAVKGVTATTSGYNVQTVDLNQSSGSSESSQRMGFQASQSLNVTMNAPGGVPPDAFTALIGNLQQDGLLLNSFDGQLSDAAQQAAEQAAITDGIHQMQAQAASVAGTLNDEVRAIKTLSVNVPSVGPFPGPRMMAMAADSAPPPQAAPGAITVTANISAEVLLTLKP